MAAKGFGALCTAREITAEEHADAVAMVQRRAVSPEDEQQLLDALGLTTTDTTLGDPA
ncbi:hypothetical protein [Streptomyces sp. NPDC019937]|uniref:hypothetical protein n=1 Tax=Streptomyces sp. NPDC019937 TaxID=3154787 RepID=UPI00340B8AAD